MKRALALFVLAAACLGFSQQPERNTEAPTRIETGLRFEAFDIFVDSGQSPLSAYQVEVKGADPTESTSRTKITLVGIEGGEHAAYKSAPFYDPAALHEDQLKDRIIIAAFNTGANLPSGKTRVARIHVQVEGPEPVLTVVVMAAATANGDKIEATATAAAAGDAR